MSIGFDHLQGENEPNGIDVTGRTFLVAALGDCPDARAVAADWVAEAMALGRAVTVLAGDDAGRLRSAVDDARAGTRVMLTGPERDLMAAIAVVRAVGALPSEVTTRVTARGGVAVFCPHCATAHDVAVVPGDHVECGTCGTVLEVRTHRSSHHGSYLGGAAEVD